MLWRPPSAGTLGPEVSEFCAAVGLPLDPWQQLCMDVLFSYSPAGQWAAFEVAILLARQNGKGGVFEGWELGSLFLLGDRQILHTAHQVKTSGQAYKRMKALVEGSAELSRRVQKMPGAHGEEGIYLTSGAELRYVARSRSSGRGFSPQKVGLDECQELGALPMDALMPTVSAQPNPQLLYAGTVPGAENDSEHFTSLRARGLAGLDPTLAWLEWSAAPPEDDDEPYDLDSLHALAQSNPALGYRLTVEGCLRERASLSDAGYARERLSIWEQRSAETVVPMALWRKMTDAASAALDPVGVGVAVMPDRSRASVGVVGRRADGDLHLQVIEAGGGTGWLVPYLSALQNSQKLAGVGVEPGTAAGSLMTDLTAARVTVVPVNVRQHGQACGDLYDKVIQGRARHRGDTRLTAALSAARKRQVGDGSGLWVWRAKHDDGDITALQAVTNALHVFGAAAPPVDRRVVVFR